MNYKVLRKFYYKLYRYFKNRSVFFYIYLTSAVFAGFVFYFLSSFLAELVYEKQMERVISLPILKLLIFFPVYLGGVFITIFLKVLWDFFTRREGVLLRTRLSLNFFIATIVPSLIMVWLFNSLLSMSINVFFADHVIDSLNSALNNIKETVNDHKTAHRQKLNLIKKRYLPEMISEFFHYGQAESENINAEDLKQRIPEGWQAGISHLFKSTETNFFVMYYRKEQIFHLTDHILPEKINKVLGSYYYQDRARGLGRVVSRYIIKDDYLITVMPFTNQGRFGEYSPLYLCAVTLFSKNFSDRASDIVTAVKRIKQFQILKTPFKQAVFIAYIYFFIPILGLGVIFFYFGMWRLHKPLQNLIEATVSIAQGDYTKRIRYHGRNEINQLVIAFNRMSSRLVSAQREQERTYRMRAWKDVAVKLAHEIKNPVTPVMLSLKMIENKIIKKNFDLYSDIIDDFNIIRQEHEKILSLIDEFTSFSSDQPLKMESCSVRDLLESQKNFLKSLKVRGIDFFVSNDVNWYVYADPGKIERVLTNLLKNAAESFDHVSETTLRNSKKISLTVRQVKSGFKESIYFYVVDNGPGIPPRLQKEILKPYFTTKKNGTGLGLLICDQIIYRHGGEFRFESTAGKTEFKFSLPAIKPPKNDFVEILSEKSPDNQENNVKSLG